MKYLIKKPDTFLNTLNEDINAILQRSFDNLFPEYIFHQELNGMAMPVDVKSEFRYGNYSRTLYFPYEIDTEKATAELKKGILDIHLPKLEKEDKKTTKLEIKD